MGAARAWDGHHGTFSSTFNRRRKSRMPVDALLAFLANSEGEEARATISRAAKVSPDLGSASVPVVARKSVNTEVTETLRVKA